MRIAEVFHSIQGEGQFAGTPSVFVRTTGCNLRCWYCDTRYTSWEPEGFHQEWSAIVERVREFDCRHVVITGGEPLLQPEVVPLTRELRQAGHYITVETAGTVYRPISADLISLSPKLSNSTPGNGSVWRERHEELREQWEVVSRFLAEYDYQFKFVIDRRDDLDEVQVYLRGFPDCSPESVWLMPQGITGEEIRRKADWLQPEAERLDFRYSPRLHIELYGNVRGK